MRIVVVEGEDAVNIIQGASFGGLSTDPRREFAGTFSGQMSLVIGFAGNTCGPFGPQRRIDTGLPSVARGNSSERRMVPEGGLEPPTLRL